MKRSEVRTIKKGQCIEFSYTPDGEVYTREVKDVDTMDGHHVHIEGIIKDKLFMVTYSEIINVLDCDTEPILA